jgi:hypothetical protein
MKISIIVHLTKYYPVDPRSNKEGKIGAGEGGHRDVWWENRRKGADWKT